VILWAVLLVNPLDRLLELLSGFLSERSWAVLLALLGRLMRSGFSLVLLWAVQ
jgi:hypothetical protein